MENDISETETENNLEDNHVLWSKEAENYNEEGNSSFILNNVNLYNSAAAHGDMSVLTELNECLTEEESSSNNKFTTYINKKNNKRNSEVLSPNESNSSKVLRISERNTLDQLIFIKATGENSIRDKNSVKLKMALQDIDKSITVSQISYSKDSIKIKCLNQEQKLKLLGVKSLLGMEVETTEHTALTKTENSLNEYNKVIIFGVGLTISDNEILEETGAAQCRRLLKKDVTGNGRSFTETVILSFAKEHEPPKEVYIGISRHSTKIYIPTPNRCWKCQRFGHSQSNCKGKLTCPKCSKEHIYTECPLITSENNFGATSSIDVKCVNCGQAHSAAFRGCPVFIKNKEILELKVTNKLTYSEAVKKYKADKEEKEKNEVFIQPLTSVKNSSLTQTEQASKETRNKEKIASVFLPTGWHLNTQVPHLNKAVSQSTMFTSTTGEFSRNLQSENNRCTLIDSHQSSNPPNPNIQTETHSNKPSVEDVSKTSNQVFNNLLYLIVEILTNFISIDSIITNLNNIVKNLRERSDETTGGVNFL